MTDDEINDRIANACGFTFVLDFATDLNAMHEAVEALTGEQQCAWVDELDRAVNAGLPKYINSVVSKVAVAQATARQRAEAFIAVVCPTAAATPARTGPDGKGEGL